MPSCIELFDYNVLVVLVVLVVFVVLVVLVVLVVSVVQGQGSADLPFLLWPAII